MHRELTAKDYKYAKSGIEELPWARQIHITDSVWQPPPVLQTVRCLTMARESFSAKPPRRTALKAGQVPSVGSFQAFSAGLDSTPATLTPEI